MPSLKLLMLGFAAGFIATLIFHQGLWYIFNQVGVIPLNRPAWAMDSTPPFEIPAVLSKAFWGGLWGLVLTSILMHLDGGMSYWAAWIVLGAVALTAVAFFVVPPLKGQPIPALWPRFFVGLALNGAWGFGTALLLRLVGAIRA